MPESRRSFLKTVGACTMAGSPSFTSQPASSARLRGVFPVGQTPYDSSGKLDLEGLAEEVRFCQRGGVHGFIWPQIASGWSYLSEKERLEGAEAILAAGKGGKTAIVIGIQSTDIGAVARYAKHAEKLGANALICLPPPGISDEKALLEFYQQVGRFSELPLFMQTQGEMSVELVVRAFETIPTLRYVKDEAGEPLVRIAELRRRSRDELAVFSGRGVRTMIREIELGFAGHCPYTGLADLYAQVFELFHGGRAREAFDMFGRILAFNSMASESGHTLLVARGVFKPGTKSREPSSAARKLAQETTPEVVRRLLEKYLKPFLRA